MKHRIRRPSRPQGRTTRYPQCHWCPICVATVEADRTDHPALYRVHYAFSVAYRADALRAELPSQKRAPTPDLGAMVAPIVKAAQRARRAAEEGATARIRAYDPEAIARAESRLKEAHSHLLTAYSLHSRYAYACKLHYCDLDTRAHAAYFNAPAHSL